MTGFIHMVTSAAQSALKSLIDTAAALTDGWRTASTGIEDGEGGIGDKSDILAAAFLAMYEQTAYSMKKTAPRMPGNFTRYAEEGQKGVDIYQAANNAAEQGFPRPR